MTLNYLLDENVAPNYKIQILRRNPDTARLIKARSVLEIWMRNCSQLSKLRVITPVGSTAIARPLSATRLA